MEISIKWNICRVCLQEERSAASQMKPIFKESRLATRIYECSGVEMLSSDGLPEKICRKCLVTLKHALTFRTTCRQSDEYLRSVMEKAKSTNFLDRVDKPNKGKNSPASDMIEDVLEVVTDDETTDYEFFYADDENFSQISAAYEDLDVKPNVLKRLNETIVEEQIIVKKPKKESTNSDTDIQNNEIAPANKSTKERCVTKNQRENIQQKISDTVSMELVETEESTYHVEIVPANKLNNNETYADDDALKKEKVPKDGTSINLLGKMKHTTAADKEKENSDNYFVLLAQEEEMKETAEYLNEVDEEETYNSSEDTEGLLKTPINENAEEGDGEFINVQMGNLSQLMNSEYVLDDDDADYKEQNDASEEFFSDEEKPVEGRLTRTYLKKQTSSHTDQEESSNSEKKILSRSGKKRLKKDDSEPKLLVCEVCGNHFTNRTLLTCHMRSHRKEKGFECELCAKRFSTACNLSAHMRIHTGEKPFECSFCQRRFTDRSTHIKHERTHTNERPFQCSVCSKAFSLSTSLRAHELIHTGEKAHRCDLCKKAFKLRHQLKAHLSTQLHKIMAAERKFEDGDEI